MPGIGDLARGAMALWGAQPLLWLVVLLIPNLVVGIAAPFAAELQWATAALWAVALGVGAAPVLLLQAGLWIHGTPPAGGAPSPGAAVLRGMGLTLPYALATAAPIALGLALRLPVTGDQLLLLGVLLATPLHALFAPALVAAATQGPGGLRAVKLALRLRSRRTWMHMGLMAALGVVVGGGGTILGWAFATSFQGVGDIAARIFQVAGLLLGESFWAAMVTVCGLDALAAEELPETPR